MQSVNFSGDAKISVEDFMRFFDLFSKEDQLKIAEKIALKTFKDRWKLLDEDLPHILYISDEEIMNEVRAVRYG